MTADDRPIALDAYEQLADRYAARIDTKPHNAYYERPAILSLLPDVDGLCVFDAGCGSGFYAQWMLDRGAEVTGVDVSPAMLRNAQERTGGRADLRLFDLRRPLDFLADVSFDLVFGSMVVHYIEDWTVPFAEFHRILRPGGLFIFSTGHPFMEARLFDDAQYFRTEPRSWPWRGFGGEPVVMPFYRRPLSATTEALWRAGFVIERLVEPLPTDDFRAADPEDYEKLMNFPSFMCLRTRRA
jgi:SAM-dependent methyltransferase